MSWKEELGGIREEIDRSDEILVREFLKRMELSRRLSDIKRDNNLPVKDETREQAVVEKALGHCEGELTGETALLMRTVMSLSRGYQHRLLFGGDFPLLAAASRRKTENVTCAYQGLAGAWSEQAASLLFPEAKREPQEYFEDVFLAVREKKADYGVVPIENSKTGAIGETYDLLKRYGLYIVGRTWIPIRQCLVGIPGADIRDIRVVVSHPEGLKQCGRFLQGKSLYTEARRNTAAAAREVAQEKNPQKAAVASRFAAKLYGLEVLKEDIMDSADNRTSFVVVAPEPEYDEESRLISFTFSTLHQPGALCESLLPLMSEGLDLARIESRPAADGNYRFFAEIEGNILEPRVASALRQSKAASEYFEVLGCYSSTEFREA